MRTVRWEYWEYCEVVRHTTIVVEPAEDATGPRRPMSRSRLHWAGPALALLGLALTGIASARRGRWLRPGELPARLPILPGQPPAVLPPARLTATPRPARGRAHAA